MSREEDLCLVPSRNSRTLEAALGQRIDAMLRYAQGGARALLDHPSYVGVDAKQLFSLADGLIVLRLENGNTLTFGDSEELASVTIENASAAELEADGWLPIEATDGEFADASFARALGRRIVGFRVLQFDVRNTATRVMSLALEGRPREAGVVIELDDGPGLLISHTMLCEPANLGIFPADALAKTHLSFREVLRIPAEAAKRRLLPIGFFSELRHGRKDGPRLGDSLEPSAEANEPLVVRYLRSGHVLMASPGVVRDVLDADRAIVASLSILTDGTYAWPSDLAHYVERYHVRLPQAFLAHAAETGWQVPSPIDVSSLQLT